MTSKSSSKTAMAPAGICIAPRKVLDILKSTIGMQQPNSAAKNSDKTMLRNESGMRCFSAESACVEA